MRYLIVNSSSFIYFIGKNYITTDWGINKSRISFINTNKQVSD